MRPSATIVIPAWNEWALTRACLETLRPTLGLRDRVVVVDNGSQDGTADGLRRYPWVQVVAHRENTGFAAGCNSGAAVAEGDIVVFLNNDTLVPARWLDGLLAPFRDPSVAATGPRSNFVSGPQLVQDVPYDAERTADLQRFARAWRDEHRGRTTEVERLVGFCLAVRRDRFEELGGFDARFGLGGAEDDDLCLRLVDAGHRLLITHESFVHHHGHRTFMGNGVDRVTLQEQNLARLADKRRRRREGGRGGPLVSACMIVKDEEENLPSCLAALQAFVDEIVVYDTGSTDGTVRLAREAGATVLEGFWDDDFARARNASLAACTGEWVLHVDADELVEGDLAQVRRELRGLSPAEDAMSVSIGNVGDDGVVGVWHNATRLFRRGRARWAGRLHEQPVSVHGRALTGRPSTLRLRHTGYTSAAVTERGKMDRNLRVAERSLQESGGEDAYALVNLGRSLSGVGRREEALVHFRRALDVTDVPGLRRQALRFGIEVLLELGRPAEALEQVALLREVCASPAMPDYLEGLTRLNQLDAAGALACFDRIGATDELRDEDMAIPGHFLTLRRGMALLADEQWSTAVEALLSAASSIGPGHALWAPLLEAHVRGGLPLDGLVALDDDPQHLVLLGHALVAGAAAGSALAEHLWHSGDRLPAVAFVGRLAPRLDLEQVLDWSVRLRGAGFSDHCPLHTWSTTEGRPVLDRLKGAAVLTAAVADVRGERLLVEVTRALEDRHVRPALVLLDELAPALLPRLLTALAADRRRIPATVQALRDLGADEQADLLRQHYAA